MAVAGGLDELTTGVRQQNTRLGFNTDEKLIDIARDLRFKLADHGITPEDLRYSGHGFANLLYIATIAVELEKTDNAELTMFLVEEPEAHLHPQLQSAVLSFLEERAGQSPKQNEDQNAPAGHLQVIVATHSPNLSAWVPCENLVVVRSVEPNARSSNDLGATEEEQSDGSDTRQALTRPRPESRCIPLSKLGLSALERRKIDRYLDVTKSAVLFGGRVLLVEGIAEALLLPIMAKCHVLKEDPQALRKFRSTAFVYIDGVDFDPYVRALLSTVGGVRIADRLVIITDGDKHTVNDGQPLPGFSRKTKLKKIAADAGAQDVLDVLVNTYSLETELIEAGNEACLREVYLALHEKSEEKWDIAVAKTGRERAIAIQGLFHNTAKGDFAQLIADKIADSSTFFVPEYIQKGIEALVK
ncbi:MAG: hypothetical protein AMXMBFR82_38540 [Candidatus Hydrogenedentota bacterium]